MCLWCLLVILVLFSTVGSLWFFLVICGYFWFFWFFLVLFGSLWFFLVPSGSVWFPLVLFIYLCFFVCFLLGFSLVLFFVLLVQFGSFVFFGPFFVVLLSIHTCLWLTFGTNFFCGFGKRKKPPPHPPLRTDFEEKIDTL